MVDTKLEYDWEKAAKFHSPERIAFYRAHFDKTLTEGEFINGMQRLKKFSTSKHKGRNNSNYQPNKLKSVYRNLKSRFGFFI